MRVKPEDKVLTYEQAKELQWFCRNVVGLRNEYYPLLEKWEAFDKRMARLEETAQMIEEFLVESKEPKP